MSMSDFITIVILIMVSILVYKIVTFVKAWYVQSLKNITRDTRDINQNVTPDINLNQIIFDVIFGIVAPILCLIFDPIIFRSLSPVIAVGGMFAGLQIFFYVGIGIEIVMLSLWLIFKPRSQQISSFFAGVLISGSLVSLAIGILILPLTLFGLFLLIGILGFAPFLTAMVFFRSGYQAMKQVRQLDVSFWVISFGGVLFVLGIPIFTQWQISNAIASSVNQVIYGDDEVAMQSAQTLDYYHDKIPEFTEWHASHITSGIIEDIMQQKSSLPPLFVDRLKYFTWCSTCLDEIVWAYIDEKNFEKKDFLAKIYRDATGEDIENRAWIFND